MNDIEKNNQIVATASTQSLIQDLRQIIEQARGHSQLCIEHDVLAYW